MVNISGIYQIQSKIYPDRIYIGSAVDIQDRWRCHLKDLRKCIHGNSRFQNHFNKYGEQDIQFTVLEECSKEMLIQREQHYIDTLNPWFNICKVAGSRLGSTLTDEQCNNLSLSHIGQVPWNKGKKATLEAIQHQSESHLGFKQPEVLNKQRSIKLTGRPSPMKNKHHSDETKQHMSKVHMGQVAWNKGLKYKHKIVA